MSIVDVIIILLVLATAVFGFFKGFIKSLVSLLGFVVSLALAILLARVVANALLGIDAIGNLVAGEKSLFSWLQGIMPDGLKDITTEQMAAAPNIDDLISQSSGVSSWFMKIFYPLVGSGLKSTAYLAAMENAQQIMAMELAYSIYVLIVGILLFVVIRIVAAVVSLIFKRFTTGKKSIGGRILGGILGAGKGFLYSMIILLVISIAANISFMQPVSQEVNDGKIASALTSATLKVTAPLLKGDENDKRHERLLEIAGFTIPETDLQS